LTLRRIKLTIQCVFNCHDWLESVMSNPFPGMDPYLEGPMWSSFHNSLIEEIAWQLTPKLRPKYRARSAERVVVAAPDPIEMTSVRSRLPDVGVFDRPSATSAETAAAPVINPPLIAELPDFEETTQTYIEIQAVDGQLVTAIELLSPTNKRGEGAGEFQMKRREFLASSVHYVEIDLLRIGERFPVNKPLPSVPYFVFLSRSGLRPQVEIWPIAIDATLPRVPIPLLAGDADVELDLALAFRTVYEHYEYDLDLDYTSSPVIPLTVTQQAWVDERLRADERR
jgi:hypothetical protein